mmetsp:Transcript_13721/g.40435  ORF Transcript_13721/g.40435 Transcript_13721/m.40435 type:complete len:258 (-) Transcript_13721:147-920(-)
MRRFDFYNSKPPSPETLKETLNMMIIVATLLFAVCVTIPFGFSHQELDEYVDLWKPGGMYDGYAREAERERGYKFTEQEYAEAVVWMVAETTMATSLLFSTLIICLIMYVSLNATSFRDAENKVNLKMLTAYWKFARVVLTIALCMLVAGIWAFNEAVYWAFDIKFPAWGCKGRMTDACWSDTPPPLSREFHTALFSGDLAPGTAITAFGNAVSQLTTPICVFILGIGIAFKTFQFHLSYKAQMRKAAEMSANGIEP